MPLRLVVILLGRRKKAALKLRKKAATPELKVDMLPMSPLKAGRLSVPTLDVLRWVVWKQLAQVQQNAAKALSKSSWSDSPLCVTPKTTSARCS